jgi:hypothetical protein
MTTFGFCHNCAEWTWVDPLEEREALRERPDCHIRDLQAFLNAKGACLALGRNVSDIDAVHYDASGHELTLDLKALRRVHYTPSVNLIALRQRVRRGVPLIVMYDLSLAREGLESHEPDLPKPEHPVWVVDGLDLLQATDRSAWSTTVDPSSDIAVQSTFQKLKEGVETFDWYGAHCSCRADERSVCQRPDAWDVRELAAAPSVDV